MRNPFGSLSAIFFPFWFFLWDLWGLFFVVWVKTRRSAKPNNFDPVLAFRHRCFSPTRTVRSETFPSICELFLQSIAINLGRVIVWRKPKLECYLCWLLCVCHMPRNWITVSVWIFLHPPFPEWLDWFVKSQNGWSWCPRACQRWGVWRWGHGRHGRRGWAIVTFCNPRSSFILKKLPLLPPLIPLNCLYKLRT